MAESGSELVDRLGCVVLAAVERSVDDPLDLATGGAEDGRHRQRCRRSVAANERQLEVELVAAITVANVAQPQLTYQRT